MQDIIGKMSESDDNGLKCKHRHQPDMKNDADMPCRRRITHVCSGSAAKDMITSLVWSLLRQKFV